MKTLISKIDLKKTMIFFISLSLSVTSCKKKDDTTALDTASEVSNSIQAGDESQANTSMDQAMDDANSALSGSVTFAGGRLSATDAVSICGASVDTTQHSQGIMTINFDGTTNCNGKIRAGQIVVQVLNFANGARWRDTGAVATVTFNNYKVTKVSTNKSATFNGVHSITNITGGLVRKLGQSGTPNPIVHKVRSSNMSITFDDGTVRSWQVARKRTFSVSGTSYSLKVEGDTTIDSHSNAVVWGTNRAGNTFTTIIETAIIASNDCNWEPTAGVKKHFVNGKTVTVTLGVDQSGNAVTSGCAYGYKVEWVKSNGQAGSSVRAY